MKKILEQAAIDFAGHQKESTPSTVSSFISGANYVLAGLGSKESIVEALQYTKAFLEEEEQTGSVKELLTKVKVALNDYDVPTGL